MTSEALVFNCPRCSTEVHEAFYGPCTDCREHLVATVGNQARKVEATAYEPKMNVVPNQVATKD